MNIFHKVTIQSLKQNKTRTTVTIIGIILSAAMICAVTTFISSIQNYILDYAVYTNGDWHGAVCSADWDAYEDLYADDQIENAFYGQLLGYADIGSSNIYKPYLYIIGGEADAFFESMPVHLVTGTLPESPDEILLPVHLASNGGTVYKTGDTITLDIGRRMLDGSSLGQNDPCYTYDHKTGETILNDENIDVKITRAYKVVGTYQRPAFEEYTSPGYTALTVADYSPDQTAEYDIYFKMKHAKEIYPFINAMQADNPHMISAVNTDVLLFSGVSGYDSFMIVLFNLAAIVIALIMLGSISLIYNAFSISVSERTKQFGLLSSIGATKKQLRNMVLFEAFSVSLIGIPAGIGVGIAGISITLLLIGSKFAALTGSFNGTMRICVSWISIVIAVIVAVITVLISAWIPSRRAAKISAIEAIRQNTDIKTGRKPLKTSWLTYKLFGLPGMLASKHYKRSRKKYRATVISLFMSIVLFVSASAFSSYLMESVTGGLGTAAYDLSFTCRTKELNGKTPDDLLELFLSDKNITDCMYMNTSSFFGSASKELLTEEFLETSASEDPTQEIGYKVEKDCAGVYGYLYFIQDSEFEKLLDTYSLNRDDYFNTAHPLAVTIDKHTQFDNETQKFITTDALKSDDNEISCVDIKPIDGYYYTYEIKKQNGKEFLLFANDENDKDIIKVPYEDAYVSYTLTSGKTITDYPFYISEKSAASLNVIYPISMAQYVIPKELSESQNNYYEYYMQSDDHAASSKNLEKSLAETGLGAGSLHDHAEFAESRRNIVTIIQVFSYGFIVLISLIAAANVFHTISTNIGLRRREFAMLQSAGMTQKGFQKMLNFECLLYGSKALILGLPVSAAITYLIYRAISDGYETTFQLPWAAIGIASLSVFTVVFVTMLYAMNKLKKDNPIDALKNENL